MKSKIQKHHQKATYTSGTKDDTNLLLQLQKDSKKTQFFTPFISETPALDIQLHPQESEEETEDLQQQLLRLKHKRRKLRHKLQQLMPKKLKLYNTI